jgi:hypothetical protein
MKSYKVFPNVHHSEENKHGGEGHYVLSDVENDSTMMYLACFAVMQKMFNLAA